MPGCPASPATADSRRSFSNSAFTDVDARLGRAGAQPRQPRAAEHRVNRQQAVQFGTAVPS